jgi:hypothetical protein
MPNPTQIIHQVQFFDPVTAQNLIIFYQNNSIVFYSIGLGSTNYIYQIDSNITLNKFSFIDINMKELFRLQNSLIYVDRISCPYSTTWGTNNFCECIMCNSSV